MRIGFTGTQRGMTKPQFTSFAAGLHLLLSDGGELHHGLCIGADEEAHNIARQFVPKILIFGHPPINIEKRMKYDPVHFTFMYKPKHYLERNHDIVDATELLIATPGEDQEQLRSGTWATIRYARKIGRKLVIIFPNGFPGDLPLEVK